MNSLTKKTEQKPKVPDEILAKWQRIVDLMARIVSVPAGLIMKVDPPQIEVLLASNTDGNPYEKGERANLNSGLYCETVMNQRSPLHVPNALKDPAWDHNPDIDLDMIFYIGFPLQWPDHDIFGTICVLDSRENMDATTYRDLISEFKELVEADLRLILETAERKRAEKQLKESEERFITLLHHIPGVSIQGYTTDGIVHYWNKASEEVYGYTAEEAIGQDLGALIIPPDIKPHYQCALEIGANAEGSGELVPAGEVMLSHKNGFRVPVFSIHTVVCLEEKPTMLFRIDVDLSERKRAEEKIRESREKLRSIVEHTNEVFYVHAPDHNLNYVSPTSKKILGYTPEEVMKKWAELATDNPLNQRGLEAAEKALETGQSQEPYLFEVRRKDGAVLMLEINESPVKDSQGNVMGLTGAARDVTNRIKAEHALKRAYDELEDKIDERTRELALANKKMRQEIDERKQAEMALRNNEKTLRDQASQLRDINTALNVLIKHRDDEKKQLEENILLNIEKMVMPYLDKLITGDPNGQTRTYLDIMKSNLGDIVSSFTGRLSSMHLNLTPTEIQVADLVRQGYSSKEIAHYLNGSIDAILFHRKNIRKKLGLTNKKTNLRSYLQRFPE